MPANFVLLERIELNASAASVTFSNIPQTGYTDLKVVMSARASSAGINNATYITLNGLTTNFTGLYLQGNGASAMSSSLARYVGQIPDSSATASTFSNTEIYFPNYTSSTNKSFSIDSVQENNTSTAGQAFCQFIAGLWSNSSAITSIMVEPTSTTFVSGSTFSLYGLAAVGSTPAIAPKASGGSIYNDGTYWYHAFRTSGTFTPQLALSCDALVVAGGGGGGSGGGGSNDGGGGGAGGFRVLTSQALTSQGYTITVGAGGTSGSGARGGVGSNSSVAGTGFTTITSSGGGGGATTLNTAGLAGGSGGGAAGTGGGTGTVGAGNAGSYSPVEGYAGGLGASDGASYDNAGGGGGAAAVGVAANAAGGGAGGAGSNTYSSWATATTSGVSGYYAGGGGGAGFSAKTAGAGGAGGGGAGSNGNGNNATAGTVNTGGGGGGGGINGIGGAGGSGIVIIRYAI